MPANPIHESSLAGGKVKLTFTCPFCNKPSSVVVDRNRYDDWAAGNGYVQTVFPELSAGERETLINGSHEECFDNAFPEDA